MIQKAQNKVQHLTAYLNGIDMSDEYITWDKYMSDIEKLAVKIADNNYNFDQIVLSLIHI